MVPVKTTQSGRLTKTGSKTRGGTHCSRRLRPKVSNKIQLVLLSAKGLEANNPRASGHSLRVLVASQQALEPHSLQDLEVLVRISNNRISRRPRSLEVSAIMHNNLYLVKM